MGGRTFHVMLSALTLVFVSGCVTADEPTDKDVMAAAGTQVDAYTSCLEEQAWSLAKASSDDEQMIVERALNACQLQRADLLDQLQKPPLNYTLVEAMDALEASDDDLRPKMLKTIEDARS